MMIIRWLILLCVTATSAIADKQANEQDFRIVLPTLANFVGTAWQSTIMQSQVFDNGLPRPVVILRDGTFTASDLVAIEGVVRSGNGLELRRPIVVWHTAQLALDGTDLRMRRDLGAFILSLGDVALSDMRVKSLGPANIDAPTFRPFVLLVGSASLSARDVEFSGLGFSAGPPYGGVTVHNVGIYQPDTPTRLEDVSFSKSGTFALVGVSGAALRRILIDDATETAMRLESVTETQLSDITIAGAGKHGLRVTRGSRDVSIARADIFGVDSVAMFIDQDASFVRTEDTSVVDSGVSGLLVANANCILFDRFESRGAGASGIILDNAQDLLLTDLRVTNSRGAGLDVRNQIAQAGVFLDGAVLAQNTRGLDAAGIGGLTLSGLDLSENFPRLVAGEFMQHQMAVLRARTEVVRFSQSAQDASRCATWPGGD